MLSVSRFKKPTQKEIHEGILRTLLINDGVIQSLLEPDLHTYAKTVLMERQAILRREALLMPSFLEFLRSRAAEKVVNHFIKQLISENAQACTIGAVMSAFRKLKTAARQVDMILPFSLRAFSRNISVSKKVGLGYLAVMKLWTQEIETKFFIQTATAILAHASEVRELDAPALSKDVSVVSFSKNNNQQASASSAATVEMKPKEPKGLWDVKKDQGTTIATEPFSQKLTAVLKRSLTNPNQLALPSNK